MHFILKLLNFSIIMRCEETKLVGVFMGLVSWFAVFSLLFWFFRNGSINYYWEKKKRKRNTRESNSLWVPGNKISWSLMIKPQSLTIIYYLYREMILSIKPRLFSLMFPSSIIYVQFSFENSFGFGTFFCCVFEFIFYFNGHLKLIY